MAITNKQLRRRLQLCHRHRHRFSSVQHRRTTYNGDGGWGTGNGNGNGFENGKGNGINVNSPIHGAATRCRRSSPASCLRVSLSPCLLSRSSIKAAPSAIKIVSPGPEARGSGLEDSVTKQAAVSSIRIRGILCGGP